MSGDQVDPAGLSHLGLLVLKGHQAKGGNGHDFPSHQKKQGSPGDDNQRHRGDKHVEEKPRAAEGLRAAIGEQVVTAVHRSESR